MTRQIISKTLFRGSSGAEVPMIKVKALTAIATKQVKAAKLVSRIAQKATELGRLTAQHDALVKGIDTKLTDLMLDALPSKWIGRRRRKSWKM